MTSLTRRTMLGALGCVTAFPDVGHSQNPDGFEGILAKARGQNVFWNAWAGDDRTNAFIAWVGHELARRFGVRVNHVKLRDTAEAVTRVVAERQAGRNAGGSVDAIWINGPNFLAMKSQGLLYGPFAEALPNWKYVDTIGKPSNVVDFTIPVDGFACPWRMAQLVFVYDSARTQADTLPRSATGMIDWTHKNPGRFTHPNVRNFMGATFLKQALIEIVSDKNLLKAPISLTDFDSITTPLWNWYGELRPTLWRRGLEFPESGPAQRQLLNDGEIDISISFNPAEASVAIANRLLPKSARVFVWSGGTVGNTSFVTIPYNASNKEGAMVLANFLLEPEAQARAQDPQNMGSFTVLDLEKLSQDDRKRFAELGSDPALPSNAELGKPLEEPHPSWMTAIIASWEKRTAR